MGPTGLMRNPRFSMRCSISRKGGETSWWVAGVTSTWGAGSCAFEVGDRISKFQNNNPAVERTRMVFSIFPFSFEPKFPGGGRPWLGNDFTPLVHIVQWKFLVRNLRWAQGWY